jgi:hypothetical protein
MVVCSLAMGTSYTPNRRGTQIGPAVDAGGMAIRHD